MLGMSEMCFVIRTSLMVVNNYDYEDDGNNNNNNNNNNNK